MMTIDDFVSKMSAQERQRIIRDYTQYEMAGAIGESVLRTKGREWMKEAHMTSITSAMEVVATRVWRFYSRKYLTFVME